jgi:hypothetical protein
MQHLPVCYSHLPVLKELTSPKFLSQNKLVRSLAAATNAMSHYEASTTMKYVFTAINALH